MTNLWDADTLRRLTADAGTPDWAANVRESLQNAIQKETTAEVSFRSSWAEFMEYRGWTLLDNPNDEPFTDYREFALTKQPHGLGISPAEFARHCEAAKAVAEDHAWAAEANPAMDNGGDRRSEEAKEFQSSNRRLKSYGTTSEYLAKRIARDHPEILERMKAGEFRSVRQAALEAGIVKPDTSPKKVRREFLKLTKKEQAEFLDWLVEQGAIEPAEQ